MKERTPKHTAAVSTLEHLGYTYCGGEHWRPPLGPAPDFGLVGMQRARIAELEAEIAAVGAGGVQPLSQQKPTGTSANPAQAAIKPIAHGGKIVRYSDMSVLVKFRSCRQASAFEQAIQAGGVQALSAAPAMPAGWKLVPVEPTAMQLTAGCPVGEVIDHFDLATAYRAMLAASPTPPAEQPIEAWEEQPDGTVTPVDPSEMQAAPKAASGEPRGDLLPCPCCGGEAKEHDRFNSNTVRCLSCGLRISQSEMGYGDAKKRWNLRSQAAPQQEAQEPVAVVKWQLGGSLVAHLVGDVAEGDLLYKGAPPQQEGQEPAGTANMEAVAQVVEDLEPDGNGWYSKVRWTYNPVPVGEELYWPQPAPAPLPLVIAARMAIDALDWLPTSSHTKGLWDRQQPALEALRAALAAQGGK